MAEITTVEQVELMPGYAVLEFTPGYTVLKIPSGFTLKLKRLPPFIAETADNKEIEDPGPFRITVKLLQINMPEAHLEQEILYEPPTDDEGNYVIPDREKDPSGWVYYKEWEAHESKRVDLVRIRGRRRWDFIMLNSIEIVDGPFSLEDQEWLEPLLYMAEEPKSIGERKLLFLKTQVILPSEAKDVIGFFVRTQEVTMEGLKKAFDSFWSSLRRSPYFSGDGQAA